MKLLQRAGYYIVLMLIVLVCLPRVFAVSTNATTQVPTPTVTPTPIVYVLPYPGLLPTHPLYVIKMLRDRVIELLITDPVNKAEFYILQADKKLNMGVALHEGKKKPDAEKVFAESLASRAQAVTLLESYVTSGGTVSGHLAQKLFLSLDKHIEIVRSIGKTEDAVRALRDRAQRSLQKTP